MDMGVNYFSEFFNKEFTFVYRYALEWERKVQYKKNERMQLF